MRLFFLLITLIPTVHAASYRPPEEWPRKTVTFQQVIDSALTRNLDLAAATQRITLSERHWEAERERQLPSLSMGAGFSHTDGRKQGSFGDFKSVDFNRTEGNLGIEWQINPLERWHAIQGAHYEYQRSRSQHRDTQQQLLFRTAELYQALLLGKRRVKISNQRLANDDTIITTVKARIRAGRATSDDLFRAQSRRALDHAGKITIYHLWTQASIEIARILRWPGPVLLEPGENDPGPWRIQQPTTGQHPEIEIAEADLAAAREKREEALWKLLGPEVDLRVQGLLIGKNPSDLRGGERYRAGLTWHLSAADWQEKRARDAALTLAATHLQRTREAVEAERNAALEATSAAQRRWREIQAAMDALEKTVTLADARYRAGKALLIELLDAEKRLFDARLRAAEALRDYNLAQVRYLSAAGRLDRNTLLHMAGGEQ